MRERITPATGAILLATSLAWQGVGFFAGMIPFVGSVWEWTGYIVFFIWFAILGVSFLSGRNAARKFGAMGAGLVFESIPWLNVFPAQVLSVFYVIYSTRKEDKAARKAANDNAPKAANDNHPAAGKKAA